MRVVVQRVSKAAVAVEGKMVAQMGHGLLILLGIEEADSQEDIDWLVSKVIKLRIFSDEAGHMYLSVMDTNGDAIIVSQFTLHASTKKGNRPSFIKAAKPEQAIPLYEKFITAFEKELGKPVGTGEFGAMMEVALVNDGPVTILIDSKNKE